MRSIVSKILYQARYDGFVRFVDGNRMNYMNNNVQAINFKEAINSIGTRNITDWDANLNSSDRLQVLLHKDDFLHSMASVLKENGEYEVIKCLNINSNIKLPDNVKNFKCDDKCDKVCNKVIYNYDFKTCNRDIFLL